MLKTRAIKTLDKMITKDFFWFLGQDSARADGLAAGVLLLHEAERLRVEVLRGVVAEDRDGLRHRGDLLAAGLLALLELRIGHAAPRRTHRRLGSEGEPQLMRKSFSKSIPSKNSD